LTFPPIYYAAFQTGSFLLHLAIVDNQGASPADSASAGSLLAMITGASLPTIFGLILFATVSAAIGFAAVHVGWRYSIRRKWRMRKRLDGASDVVA